MLYIVHLALIFFNSLWYIDYKYIETKKTECLLTDDFNIDLLTSDVHSATEHFINKLHCHLLIPLIVIPTRFETHSSTLTNNIFTNRPRDLCVSVALITDISDQWDHLHIFYIAQITIKQYLPKYFILGCRHQIILHSSSLF